MLPKIEFKVRQGFIKMVKRVDVNKNVMDMSGQKYLDCKKKHKIFLITFLTVF